MSWFVYIVECSDYTLYTGITNNFEKRIKEHNEGSGAKYTKSRRPVKVVYKETHSTRSSALKREYKIKKMSRKKKLDLVKLYAGVAYWYGLYD